jgi:hypothetical protein
MIEQQSRWTGARTSQKSRVARFPTLRIRIGIYPLRWVLSYRLATATGLICLALFVYVLQVNRGARTDYGIFQARVTEIQNQAKITQLLVSADGLRSRPRIERIATRELHMTLPSLPSVQWLSVTVPTSVPKSPQEPNVRTGPSVWLDHAFQLIRASL